MGGVEVDIEVLVVFLGVVLNYFVVCLWKIKIFDGFMIDIEEGCEWFVGVFEMLMVLVFGELDV